jgi:hypothetical protein
LRDRDGAAIAARAGPFVAYRRAGGSRTLRVIEIPPTLRQASTVAGETAWLDALPDLVGEMASRWWLEIGRSLDGFGVNALVMEATTTARVATVVKIAPPSDAEKLAYEATVLRLAAGDGCVRLHDADVARRALLLERLGRRCTTSACHAGGATNSSSVSCSACGDPSTPAFVSRRQGAGALDRRTARAAMGPDRPRMRGAGAR